LRTLIYITLTKLIGMPIIGVFIVLVFQKIMYLDPILVFITIITCAAPTANNLLLLANLYAPNYSGDVSKILLIQWLLLTITIPIILNFIFLYYN
jgi:predicted permease